MAALQRIQRNLVNEDGFEIRKPNVNLDDFVGYENIKSRILNLIRFPIQHKESYERLGVSPPSGMLLHGPAGCGKTFLVNAVASSLPVNFITVQGNKLYSKYFGETEERLRKLFQLARRISPCILFFDDLDTIGTRREWDDDGVSGLQERILSTLLNEMDGVSLREGVLIIGTTNRPDKLDDALLRPGRLDQHIHIPLPSEEDRHAMLKSFSPPANQEDPDCPFRSEVPWDAKRAAHLTQNFTGADLRAVVREAAFLSLREYGASSLSKFLAKGTRKENEVVGFAWKHFLAALIGAIDGFGSNRKTIYQKLKALGSIHESVEREKIEKLMQLRGDMLHVGGWWKTTGISAEDLKRFDVFREGRKR
ncbi:AAA ATPase cdc48 [Phlyctochytrium planicorne]|nr:AAA ATPase cdc48 [Phlyctochytrium planicorne]